MRRHTRPQQQWNHLEIERRVTGTSEILFVLWCHRPNATTTTINIHFRERRCIVRRLVFRINRLNPFDPIDTAFPLHFCCSISTAIYVELILNWNIIENLCQKCKTKRGQRQSSTNEKKLWNSSPITSIWSNTLNCRVLGWGRRASAAAFCLFVSVTIFHFFHLMSKWANRTATLLADSSRNRNRNSSYNICSCVTKKNMKFFAWIKILYFRYYYDWHPFPNASSSSSSMENKKSGERMSKQ